MDANNWRPTAPGGEPVMDTGDWRTQLQPDSRQRIVNKIMETLKRHLPFSGQEGLQELKKIAVRFEEKIYTAATNQSDYLRKISLKMLTMETKSQNTIPTGNGNKTLDPGASHSMPPQVHNQGQSLPNSLSSNQSQARQQLSQNMQNSMSSNGVQSSAGLQSAMPSVSGLTQTIPNTVGQNANMQSISGVSQNPVGNSMGQGIPPNMFVNSQRQMPASLDSTAETGHANGADWQEEIYQKIKVMKETYLPEINEMDQRIATKLQQGNWSMQFLILVYVNFAFQHDPLPQQPKSEQLEKLKLFKVMLERLIGFLQVPKNNITPNFKEKLGSYEKQILGFLNPSRYRKPIPNLQQGQLPQPHIQPMQQPQSQVPQLQSHENQLNSQLQSINMQGSVPKMQQNNMSSLLHNSLSTLSGDSTSQSNMMNPIQPGSNLDSGQGNALSSLQQTPVGSVQQNLVSISQPTNVNTMSTQSGVSMMQPNMPLQSNSNMIQHQHLKQQQQHEQHMLQTQQLKRMQQRQNLMQNQQMLQQQQQLHQQAKQQLPAQMQTHQIPQPQQMNDVNEMRQGIGIKPAVFQQHLPTAQRTAFPRQHMKPAPSFPISSPQLPQHASPQLQHSSPQIDQQNLPSSVTKTGTPLQSANSPFVVPSPSTPLAPSPMPGDSDKPVSGISSLLNTGNIVHQPSVAQAPAPSLAIGTPGISASPLLAEFTSPDGAHGGALTTVSGKSNVTEQPLERLIKAANHALLEEIREINQRLIDTVVDISDEDVDSTAVAATAEGGEGTIVKCSFSAVALSQNLKSQYASAQMSPIQPLRLLVPTNYPSCSPILLDRFPVEVSKEYEDLSIKAKSRFSISLRSLSQPMSLGEIARTWDVCARVVISEHAQQSGGGTFSSKYGSWENCLSAA
uniref:Mediator complex subunit 15 KIX domain-containing protein n=1 Tax=Populus trichocarpa TaxID=3694 RepID=A0A2K2B0P6_POPTR